MTDWMVYIVRCNDETYYTGITTDITRRVKQHNSGKGAKYTACRGPVELVDFVCVETRSDALKLEAKIKRQPRADKLETLRG